MNAHVSPATAQQIGTQVLRLTNALPPPRNRDVSGMTDAYFAGLKGFPVEAITDAIDALFAGRFGEKRWLPEAPELSTMVRSCLSSRGEKVEGRHHAYSMPRSAILKQGCTKEWVAEQRAKGLLQPGVIWIPGAFAENARWGDLFAPDPKWKPATRIATREEAKAAGMEAAA